MQEKWMSVGKRSGKQVPKADTTERHCVWEITDQTSAIEVRNR